MRRVVLYNPIGSATAELLADRTKENTMNNRWLVKLAGGGALLMAVLVLQPGSWEREAGARAKSVDLIMAASFQVEVEGKFTAIFKGCSGIGSTSEIIEHKVGTKDGKQTIQRIPGRVMWSDAVLSRGLTTDLSLNQWRQDVIDGRTAEARKKCVITVFDAGGKPGAIWELNNAWPSGLIMKQKDDGTAVIEELTIAYEAAVRKQ